MQENLVRYEALRTVLRYQAASASFGRSTRGPRVLYALRFLGSRATPKVADIVGKEPWRITSGQTRVMEERG
jgi:hypothetical protein